MIVRWEQIHVAAWVPMRGRWVLRGDFVEKLPLKQLGGCHLYLPTVQDVERAMAEAIRRNYQVLGGHVSDRRGLRSATIGVGAWGWMGTVQIRTADAWCLDSPVSLDEDDLTRWAGETQDDLRGLCRTLNEMEIPFRPTAHRYVGAVYDCLGRIIEPEGHASPLPTSVARLCRHAHVSGPIVHAKTVLAPFCTLDRRRAYGDAMLEHLPSGPPIEIHIEPGRHSLRRWRPHDLQRALGLAEATIEVFPGPCVPLWPVLRPSRSYERARTLYPVGRFRGTWMLSEIAALERHRFGELIEIHQCVTFQGAPVFAPVIEHLRKIERHLPSCVSAKRLEHVLYGKCARSLSSTRIGSGPSWRPPSPQDLMDDRTYTRVEGATTMQRFALPGATGAGHPLWRVRATLSAQSEVGSGDRPDRAAFVTSHNRVAMLELIRTLDMALKPQRSGDYVGRVYVDGIDVQARPEDLPPIEGASLRRHGPSLRIWRSAASVARLHDGSVEVEGGGFLQPGSTPEDLEQALRQIPEMDGGPLAAGRLWPITQGEPDPRNVEGVRSEPLEVTAQVLDAMGFGFRR